MSEDGKTKEEKFKANPDNFIDINDLILAAKRGEKGIEVLIGHPDTPRNELLMAKAELDHLSEQRLTQIDMVNYAKKKQGIVGVKNKMDFKKFLNKGAKVN